MQKANSGHPGMPMGMADVATVLFRYHLRFSPKILIGSIEIDLFYLPAMVRCCFTLYFNWLHKSISIDDIKNFRQLNSICAGHPEYKMALGLRQQLVLWDKD